MDSAFGVEHTVSKRRPELRRPDFGVEHRDRNVALTAAGAGAATGAATAGVLGHARHAHVLSREAQKAASTQRAARVGRGGAQVARAVGGAAVAGGIAAALHHPGTLRSAEKVVGEASTRVRNAGEMRRFRRQLKSL